MLCKEIIEVIERTYPKQAAMEWDNVGLLVGRTDKEVKRVLVALDLTDDVLAEAIDSEIDMIVTHHPLIFTPLKKITNEHFIGNRVVKLLQHDISYYAMHTNYDVLGMAELSGRILGLQQEEVLEVTNAECNQGIGRVGELQENMTLEACCELVKNNFNILFPEPGEIATRLISCSISPNTFTASKANRSFTCLQQSFNVILFSKSPMRPMPSPFSKSVTSNASVLSNPNISPAS